MGNLTILVVLSLEQNMVTGPILEDLGKLTDLEGLWLCSNLLSGLTKLEELMLYNN
jgi:hypothetical protein